MAKIVVPYMKMLPALALLLLCCMKLSAQIQLPENIPSPNTASLGKYGCTPVSYYTGVPDISIPMYEFNVRGVRLPVSVRYDASGLLVNGLPGWLGHNWSMEAGGVITRTVKGRYDEWLYPQQSLSNMNYTPKDYYHSLGVLPALLANTSNNYKALKDESLKCEYDLAADIFTFNFMGHAGRFFLDNYGNWQMLSDDNLEVIFNYNDTAFFTSPFIALYPYKYAIDRNQPKTIKGFKLRDSDGVTYEFGWDMDAIEFYTNFYNMSGNEDNESWHAMSWYLTRVSDRFGNELYRLEYDRGCYIIQAFNLFEASWLEEQSHWSWAMGSYGQAYSSYNTTFPFGLNITSPVYLNSIHCSNGVVCEVSSSNSIVATEDMYSRLYDGFYNTADMYSYLVQSVNKWTNGSMTGAFHYLQTTDSNLSVYKYVPADDNDPFNILRYSRLRKLDRVIFRTDPALLDGPDQPVIGYRFYYGYNSRMHLDSIRIKGRSMISGGTGDNMDGIYRFRYDGYSSVPADYLSTAYDHWGYYNGRPYGLYNLPDNVAAYNSFSSTRAPNFDYAKLGSLVEIQYPTGGTTVFEYEANDFGACMSRDRQTVRDSTGTGGGLRIKSVSDYDSPTHDTLLARRTFDYRIPGTSRSSGELFAAPVYYWPEWTAYCIDGSAWSRCRTFRTSSILPLSNSFGPSLGYTYVKETHLDGSSTLYKFSNISDPDFRDERYVLEFQSGGVTPYDEYSEKGFKRGKLLLRTDLSPSNQKLRSVGYRYRSDNIGGFHTLTTNMGYVNHGNSSSFGYFSGGIYKIYYPKYDVVEESDTVFDGAASIVTDLTRTMSDMTLSMAYNHPHTVSVRLPVSEQVSRGGQTERTDYAYASPASLLTSNMFCLHPVSVASYSDGTSTKTETTTYKTVTCNGSLCEVPHMLLVERGGVTDTAVVCSDYSSTGALLRYKERGKPEKYLKWGWNDNYLLLESTRPISLSVGNAVMFNTTQCLTAVRQYITSTQGISKGYVYTPLTGVAAIVDQRGIVTSYSYDLFGRLSGIYDHYGSVVSQFGYNYYKGPGLP